MSTSYSSFQCYVLPMMALPKSEFPMRLAMLASNSNDEPRSFRLCRTPSVRTSVKCLSLSKPPPCASCWWQRHLQVPFQKVWALHAVNEKVLGSDLVIILLGKDLHALWEMPFVQLGVSKYRRRFHTVLSQLRRTPTSHSTKPKRCYFSCFRPFRVCLRLSRQRSA